MPKFIVEIDSDDFNAKKSEDDLREWVPDFVELEMALEDAGFYSANVKPIAAVQIRSLILGIAKGTAPTVEMIKGAHEAFGKLHDRIKAQPLATEIKTEVEGGNEADLKNSD
jgi:hypothetical protein